MESNDIEKLRNIINNISRLNDEWFYRFPTYEGQPGIHDAIKCEIMEADKILAALARDCEGQKLVFSSPCTEDDVRTDEIRHENTREAQAYRNARKQRARELTKARELEIKKAKGNAK